ncbi:MAG TPA: DUF3134 family protein [Coleofasciculaceae cyanobacterium]|jgi:hypothetical protein
MPISESHAPYHNPALHEELLTAKVYIIPPRANESLLNWVEASGRFKIETADIPYDQVASVELDEILLDAIDEPEEETEEGGWDT